MIQIKFLQDIIPGKYSSLWYGGPMIDVEYHSEHLGTYTFRIDAIGDVRATYKDGGSLEYMVDKNNAGEFAQTIGRFFDDDDELEDAIYEGCLTFQNNNWWEISVVDPNNVWHDLTWVAGRDNIYEALNECFAGMEDTINYLEDNNE